jgi:hypothetical protein
MPSDLCLDALTELPGWLGPTAAAATVVLMVLPTLVWSAVVLVALFTRDDKRAERAMRILEYFRYRAGRAHDRRRRSDRL